MTIHDEANAAAAAAEALLSQRQACQDELDALSRRVDRLLAAQDAIDLELAGSQPIATWARKDDSMKKRTEQDKMLRPELENKDVPSGEDDADDPYDLLVAFRQLRKLQAVELRSAKREYSALWQGTDPKGTPADPFGIVAAAGDRCIQLEADLARTDSEIKALGNAPARALWDRHKDQQAELVARQREAVERGIVVLENFIRDYEAVETVISEAYRAEAAMVREVHALAPEKPRGPRIPPHVPTPRGLREWLAGRKPTEETDELDLPEMGTIPAGGLSGPSMPAIPLGSLLRRARQYLVALETAQTRLADWQPGQTRRTKPRTVALPKPGGYNYLRAGAEKLAQRVNKGF